LTHQEFAEFFIRNGKQVVETASGHWYKPYPFCFQSIPYHQAINPHKKELRDLFFKNLAILVRFNSSTKEDTIPGSIWICEEKNYDFANLDAKARNKTRRGLERNLVEEIDFNLIIKEGWDLINDTAQRQQREPDFATPGEWIRYCKAAASIPDFEAWGAFSQEHLAAFLVGAQIGDYYWILRQVSKTVYLKNHPNNALVYTVTKSKLADPSISKVSYGLDSVEETEGLRKFKIGMGYSLEIYAQKVVINPLFQWMKCKKFNLILNILFKSSPNINYLRKAKAILKKIAD
jgi:hypothetical protein